LLVIEIKIFGKKALEKIQSICRGFTDNQTGFTQSTAPTIPSQETAGRFFIYIPELDAVRKLTINECYRIMGFESDFIKHSNTGEQYKQIGNSVAIPVVRAIAESIKEQML
jgi:site-specific DNA-cytosine methylase